MACPQRRSRVSAVSELERYFVDYRIEVALEMVRRQTQVDVEPATLETIFTDRAIRINDMNWSRPV